MTLPLLRVLDAMLADTTRDRWGFDLIKDTGLQSGTLRPTSQIRALLIGRRSRLRVWPRPVTSEETD
jgi:hypothetical protein